LAYLPLLNYKQKRLCKGQPTKDEILSAQKLMKISNALFQIDSQKIYVKNIYICTQFINLSFQVYILASIVKAMR